MSRTARKLIVQAPDGTDVTLTTSGGYDVAGIIKAGDGTWALAAKGSSWESVTSRTRTRLNRSYTAVNMHVGPLFEETAGAIREYYGTHAVRVTAVFTPDGGWKNITSRDASARTLRCMRAEGVTEVHTVRHGRREFELRNEGDFQMDELLDPSGHLIRRAGGR